MGQVMERVRLEELRKELGRWIAKAQRKRFVVTRRDYDVAGVCSVADVRLLERLEASGALEGLRAESDS